MRKLDYISRSPDQRDQRLNLSQTFSPPEKLTHTKSPTLHSTSSFFEMGSLVNSGDDKTRKSLGNSDGPLCPTFDKKLRRNNSWSKNSDIGTRQTLKKSEIGTTDIDDAKGKLESLMRRIDGFVEKSADLLANKPKDIRSAQKQKQMLDDLMAEKYRLQGKRESKTPSPSKPPMKPKSRVSITPERRRQQSSSKKVSNKSQFSRVSELLGEMQGQITKLLSPSSDISKRGKVFDIFEKFKERMWSEFFSTEPEIEQLERERKELETTHSQYLAKLNEQMTTQHEQDMKRIDTLIKERNKMSQKFENVNGEIHGLKIACEAKDRLIEVMEKKNRENMPQKEVLKLKFKAQEMKSQLSKVARTLTEKEKEAETLKDTLQFERHQNEQSIKQLKNKIRAIGDEFYRTEQNLKPDKLVAAFEKDKIKYVQIIEGLKVEKKALKSNLKITQEGRMDLETELMQIRTELATIDHEDVSLLNMKIGQQNEIIQDLKEENAELASQVDTASNDIFLQQQIAKLQMDIEETEEQKFSLQRQLEKTPLVWQEMLHKNKLKYKLRISEVEESSAEALTELKILQSSMDSKKHFLNKANAENERLSTQLYQLKTQTTGNSSQVDEIEKKLKKKKLKYTQVRKDLSRLANQLGGSPRDMADLLSKALIAQPDISSYNPVRKLTYKGESFTILEDPSERVQILPSHKAPGQSDTLETFKSETEVCVDMLLTGEGTALDKVTALLNEPKIDTSVILKEAEFKHRREITELKEKIKRYEDNLFNLNQIYETSKSEVITLKETLKIFETQLDSVQKELLGEKAKPPSVSQQDHFELQTQAKVQEMELDQLRSDLQSASKRFDDSRLQLQERISQKNAECDQLRTQIHQTQSSSDESTAKLLDKTNLQMREISQLKNTINAKNTEIDAFRVQLSSLQEAGQETQIQLEENVDNYQLELKQLKSQLSVANEIEAERDDLIIQSQNLQSQNDQLIQKLGQSKDFILQLQSQVDSLDQEIEILREQAQASTVYEKEISVLREQATNSISQSEHADLISQMSLKSREISMLQADLVQAEKKCERQSRQLQEVTAKLERTKSKLSELRSKNESELFSFREQLKFSEEQISYTKNKYKSQLNAEKSEHASLQQSIQKTAIDLGIPSDISVFLDEISRMGMQRPRSFSKGASLEVDEGGTMVRRVQHGGDIWCLFTPAISGGDYWIMEGDVNNYWGEIPNCDPDPDEFHTLQLQIVELEEQLSSGFESLMKAKDSLVDKLSIQKARYKEAKSIVNAIEDLLPAGSGSILDRVSVAMASRQEIRPIVLQDDRPEEEPKTSTPAEERKSFTSISESSEMITSVNSEELSNLIQTLKTVTKENEELEMTLKLQEQQIKLLNEERKEAQKEKSTEAVASNFEYLKELFITFVSKLPELKSECESILRVLCQIFELTKTEINEITLARGKIVEESKKPSILSSIFNRRSRN